MTDHSLHILVTGASRGLGASLAKHCAQHYANNQQPVLLSLVARNESALADCARQCQHYGAEVNYYIADLQNIDTTMTTIKTIARQPVDIAFINAAASGYSTHGEEPWAQQQTIIQTNLIAAMACATGLIPSMKQRQQGKLVFISSIAAYRGFGLNPSYNASKAGIKCYADSMRHALAGYGISVCTVMPGFISSDMSAGFTGAKPLIITSDKAAMIILEKIDRQLSLIQFPWALIAGQKLLSLLPSTWADKILTWLSYGTVTDPSKFDSQ